MIAIPWYFTKTNNLSYFNFSYGLLTILILFFGLYAGILVDRFSRKMNFLITSAVCGTLIILISIFGFANNTLPDFLIMMVFGITMLNYNIHYPTLYAFGQEISDPSDYNKINSQIEIVGQSTTIISGAVAAILLTGMISGNGQMFGFNVNIPFSFEPWTIWEIFLLDGLTYFVAVSLISLIKYTPNPRLKLQSTGLMKGIKTGVDYLKKHSDLVVFGIFSYSVFATLLVVIHSVLAPYVKNNLHENASVYAGSELIYALGALTAGLFITKIFAHFNITKVIIALTLTTGAFFLWTFATNQVFVLYIMSIVLGFSNAGIRVLRVTYLFKRVPNELMGRVNSIFNVVNVITRTLLIFLFSLPFFASGNNIIWAFLVLSIFLFVSGLILIFDFKNIK